MPAAPVIMDRAQPASACILSLLVAKKSGSGSPDSPWTESLSYKVCTTNDAFCKAYHSVPRGLLMYVAVVRFSLSPFAWVYFICCFNFKCTLRLAVT